tara:strand:+ start:86 stop:1114 length:1029 start_codon:yes stop_codon:yes gene_type:complete
MVKVGVVGGTGYTGVELLRILSQHPKVEIKAITSRKEAGTSVEELFPGLRGKVNLKFSNPDKVNLQKFDVVFFATPNGVAMQQTEDLLDAGVRVIDLAADFRIKDVSTWEKWYSMKHDSPSLLEEAVYGLPEINRKKIKAARLVANPGCYPTAVQLGFLPLIESKVIDLDHLIADVKSGVSGAGRNAEIHTLYAEASDNFKAYKASGHRHHPEIQQSLSNLAGKLVNLTFVPHLVPMIRGIHATLYANLTKNIDLQRLFENRYVNEPFVDVLSSGGHPETRSVRGSNFCRIAVHRPQEKNTVVILVVTDNLVKGAAGQAVQNMNIMFGFNEMLGINQVALIP